MSTEYLTHWSEKLKLEDLSINEMRIGISDGIYELSRLYNTILIQNNRDKWKEAHGIALDINATALVIAILSRKLSTISSEI